MIRLMIKIHEETGMKYLCITRKPDYLSYRGSGKYWLNILRKYPSEITTILIHESESMEEISFVGEFLSYAWDIVGSEEWANLIPEIGYCISRAEEFRAAWFMWWGSLSEEELGNRSKNISSHVKKRLAGIPKKERSRQIREYRLGLSEEKKKQRADKIREKYKTGVHDHLFEKMSRERRGGNNPAARKIVFRGVTYDSIREASEATGVEYHRVRSAIRRMNNEENRYLH